MENTKEIYGVIYITTNMVNGKKYIGQKKFDDRWENYLGSGKAFKRALDKYGKENFYRDIVAIAYSKEELDNLEIEFIECHNAVKSENYYNIATGGDGGNTLAGKTEEEMEEIRKKMSESRKGKYVGENSHMYCKHHDEETKNKISQANKGKKLSEETKQKLREINLGKKHTEESKKKISSTLKEKGRFKGVDNPRAKKVICVTTNKVFDTIKEASEFYGCNGGNISNCCTGKKKSAGKHPETGEKLVWRYYSDYLLEINQAS